MPLILGTNSIKDTGYNVANSLRFDDGSSDRLNRTLGTPTNNYKWTYSFWLKRGILGSEDAITGAISDSQNKSIILFRTDDQLEIMDLQVNHQPFHYDVQLQIDYQYHFDLNQYLFEHFQVILFQC